jgi:outer membrane protein assembly factor BamB
MKKILAILMILTLLAAPALALNNAMTVQYTPKTSHDTRAVDWWPMFYHDTARTGNSSSPAPPINQTKWNHTVGDWIESSPTIVEGKAYVTTINWWKGHIHCLDLYNGTFLWNYSISDQLYSSPAVSDGKLYVASLNGRLLCLNTSTGQEIWNILLDTDILIQSSPVVYGGRVYISCTNEYPATNRSKLYCVYTENGSVAWYNSTKNAKDITPAVVDGKVYGAGAENYLTCFDALTGAMNWQSNEQITTSQPVVVNGNVFGADDTSVYCVHDGVTVWDFPLKPGFLVASALVEGSGRLFVGALNPYASIPGMIHCINIETGQAYWNYSSQTNGEYNAKPTIASNRLYISEDTGVGTSRRARICCFDVFTGNLLSARYVNTGSTNYVYGTLSIADGLLVFGSTEMDATTVWGGIYCYGATSVPQPDLNITKISGGKKITIDIENKGAANATGVTGQLVITGGLFIHQGAYSFPETIPAGETITVDVPLFGVGLGFLKAIPQISVNINCTEGSSDTTLAHFKIFLSRITMVEEE